MGVYGLDISNYQAGLTDYGGIVRDGYEYVFILCSDGAWAQPHFKQQLNGCRGRGLLVAAYHYQRENQSAETQVAIIASQVPVDVPVIIDVEHYSGRGKAGVDLCRRIVDGLRARGYKVPLVYIPRWYWTSPVDAPKGGLGYADLSGLPPLWVSWYPDYVTRTKENGLAQLPSSVWNGYGGLWVAVAQYTSSGRVSGYSAAVDQNFYRGSRAELAALLGGEDDMSWDMKVTRPDGQTYEMWELVMWDNIFSNEIPHIRDTVNMIAEVVVAIANDGSNQVSLTEEQLARLQAGVSADVTAGLGALQEFLAEKLGTTKDTVRQAMQDFFRPAVEAPPASAADKNEDGLRGGAAAPEGVGGPNEGDPVGDETEEKS